MQVFQKQEVVLGGMDEAIAILKLCSHDWEELTVHALYDGDAIAPWETVMKIEGDYTLFAHLETPYLGVLARRTLVSTNVAAAWSTRPGASRSSPLPGSDDHHRVQTGDGYAAPRRGRDRRSIDAQASWWGGPRHRHRPTRALSPPTAGTRCSRRRSSPSRPRMTQDVVVLVDFENDSVRTSFEVARAMGDRLWGVRLDTSRTLVDRSLWNEMGDFDLRGVNERLRHAKCATRSTRMASSA